MAEVYMLGTNRLHHTDEHASDIVDRKKKQQKSHQMEQHRAKPGKSKCWKKDPDGFRT